MNTSFTTINSRYILYFSLFIKVKKLICIIIILYGCNEQVQEDLHTYIPFEDIKVVGYVPSFSEYYGQNYYLSFVITSSSVPLEQDTLKVDKETFFKWAVPYPRQRVGLVLKDTPVIFTVKRVEITEYRELIYIVQNIEKTVLLGIEYPNIFTRKGIFNYSSFFSDRDRIPPNIHVFEEFTFTQIDSTLQSVDR